MYPAFVAEAEIQANKVALTFFKEAMAVEKIHHTLYTEALMPWPAELTCPRGRFMSALSAATRFMTTPPTNAPSATSPKTSLPRLHGQSQGNCHAGSIAGVAGGVMCQF